MITGKKSGKAEDAISSSHAVWGVIIAIMAGVWIAALFAAHNTSTATFKLPVIGVTLQLGESSPAKAGKGDIATTIDTSSALITKRSCALEAP